MFISNTDALHLFFRSSIYRTNKSSFKVLHGFSKIYCAKGMTWNDYFRKAAPAFPKWGCKMKMGAWPRPSNFRKRPFEHIFTVLDIVRRVKTFCNQF